MIDISYKYYFVDFFGTIMDRRCSSDDIKKMWSTRMSLLLDGIVSSQQLYAIRILAEEHICSCNEYAEFMYDELIKEIYYRLQTLLNFRSDMLCQKDFVILCRKTEIQIEVENQKLTEDTIELIGQLKHNHKRVYIL